MPIVSPPRPVALLALAATVAVTSACTAEPSDDSVPRATDSVTLISVTVPPERLTPFCQGMIELTDELREGDVDDAEELIIETYRDLLPAVPDAIADDFTAVLSALEAGAPPPTDPPTTVAISAPPAPDDSLAGDAFFEEGYGPGRSPTERINNYVAFACRDSENNPGPPPTQPLEDIPTTDP